VAGGIGGGLKNAASWVAGTEAPQSAGTPPPAPVTVPVAAAPDITQQVSLIPKLREELMPRALEAVLNLKPGSGYSGDRIFNLAFLDPCAPVSSEVPCAPVVRPQPRGSSAYD